ncbi:MAG: hypothetical protein MJZ61_07675 [Bacteroidales bacterium]|nr:hypothetical protein [Bacteroidales bacterium]
MVSDINITGNKKTKPNIILCELELRKGDTVPENELQEKIDKSQRNLLKTSLFNYVTIRPEIDSAHTTTTLNITVEERWYIWPQFNITPHNGNLNQWLANPDLDLIDYCIGVKKYNFRGRREILYLNFRRGFNNITQFGYQNIAFDQKRQHQASINISIRKQKSLILKTEDNKAVTREFAGIKNAISEKRYELTYTYRPAINVINNFSIGHVDAQVADSVAIQNSDYLGNGRTNIKGVTLKYDFKLDKRSSAYYPLQGSFLATSITKTGVMSKTIDTYMLDFDIRKYCMLNPRQYFATQIFYSTSSNSIPFYMMRSIGSKPNILEGYEYNMITGKQMSYIKTSYKVELIKQHILHLKRINIPKFNKIHYAVYLNTFANAGYVSSKKNDYTNNNTMNDTFLGAIGIGLDVVTYYDRVFTTYVTHNMQGATYFGVGVKSAF